MCRDIHLSLDIWKKSNRFKPTGDSSHLVHKCSEYQKTVEKKDDLKAIIKCV